MNTTTIISIVSVFIASVGLYFQNIRRPRICCVRPTNAIIGNIGNYGMAITVPLSLSNPGARPMLVERFSCVMKFRSELKIDNSYQIGLQWFTCDRLDVHTNFQLGIPQTIAGRSATQINASFICVSGWQFFDGHTEVNILAHTKSNPDGKRICGFDLGIDKKDIDTLKNEGCLSLFQRWYGKHDSSCVLISHELSKRVEFTEKQTGDAH